MSKKKICFVAQFPPPIHGLTKAVETLFNSRVSEEFELSKIDISNNKKFFSTLIKIIRSDADLFYFTISQTRGGNLRDLLILKFIELKRKKCLVHLHGGYYRKLIENGIPHWQKVLNENACKKLAGAIVLGDSLRWIFEGIVAEDKIYTVPNCVDDQFLMDEMTYQRKIAESESKDIKHVLYLSNFIRSKGYFEVLKLAKKEKENVLKGKNRRFHFDFAGKFFESEEENAFREYVRDNDLSEYVTYHGVVGGVQKAELLKNSDYFALITRYLKEGQPISILEAMGNGMIIVTTDHAGIPDIVDENSNIIIKDENVDIDVLYDKLDYRYEDVEKNRNAVITKYREDHYINNMISVFQTVIGD